MPTIDSLFGSVPEHDYLKLVDNPSALQEFLDFKTNDMARALQVRGASARRLRALPQETRDRLMEIAMICERVAGHFRGDARRTSLWFRARNPLLGGITPRDLIRVGRYQTLRSVVEAALSGQTP